VESKNECVSIWMSVYSFVSGQASEAVIRCSTLPAKAKNIPAGLYI